MALSDKVGELERTAATLIERVTNAAESLGGLHGAHEELAREFSDLRRAYEREIALQRRDLDDFKKWQDEQKKEREERNRRLWAFGPNLLGAVVNGLIAAAVAYFISHR